MCVHTNKSPVLSLQTKATTELHWDQQWRPFIQNSPKKICNPLQRVIQGFLQQTGDYLLIKMSIWSWFWKTKRMTGGPGNDQVPATVMLPLLLSSTGLWGCENDMRSWPRRKLTALQPKSLCSHTQMPSCRLNLSPTYLRNVPPSPGHSCDAGMQLAGNHAFLF